jgi:hypothetical protein
MAGIGGCFPAQFPVAFRLEITRMSRSLEAMLPPTAVADIQERLGGGTSYRKIREIVWERYGRNVSLGSLSTMNLGMGNGHRRATKDAVAKAEARVMTWPTTPRRLHAQITGVSLSTVQKIRMQHGLTNRQMRMDFTSNTELRGGMSEFDFFVHCITNMPASEVVGIFPNISTSKVYFWRRKIGWGERGVQQLTRHLMDRCADHGWLCQLNSGKIVFTAKIAPVAETLGVPAHVLRYHLDKTGYNQKQQRSQNAKDLERVRRMQEEADADDFRQDYPELEAAIQDMRRKSAEARRIEVPDEDAGRAEGPGAPGAEVHRSAGGGDTGHADPGADFPPPSDASERTVDRGESPGRERHAEAGDVEFAEEVLPDSGPAQLHASMGRRSVSLHDGAELPSRVVRLPRKRPGQGVADALS